jgi:hypothetical protein
MSSLVKRNRRVRIHEHTLTERLCKDLKCFVVSEVCKSSSFLLHKRMDHFVLHHPPHGT